MKFKSLTGTLQHAAVSRAGILLSGKIDSFTVSTYSCVFLIWVLYFLGAIAVAGAVNENTRYANAFPPKGTLAGVSQRMFMLKEQPRAYLVQQVQAPGLHPVVVMLHGGSQAPTDFWTQTSLPTLGRRNGFIVVAPMAGDGKHWNDGRRLIPGISGQDDLAYLRGVIENVIAKDRGDPGAVFIVGIGNGGSMAMRMACEADDLIHAGGNIDSELSTSMATQCTSAKPLPWISINGNRDILIPYNGEVGGRLQNGQLEPGLLSSDATFKFFADRAGCGLAEQTAPVPHRDPEDESWVERRTRTGCTQGTQSVYYLMHEGDHTGLRLHPILSQMVGNLNQDVDPGSLLWDHFQSTLHANYDYAAKGQWPGREVSVAPTTTGSPGP